MPDGTRSTDNLTRNRTGFRTTQKRASVAYSVNIMYFSRPDKPIDRGDDGSRMEWGGFDSPLTLKPTSTGTRSIAHQQSTGR